MIQVDATVLTLLVGLTLGLVIWVLALVFRISSRLERLENQLKQGARRESSDPEESDPSVAETSRGGAFEAFLDEEPERRGLSKAEQFSAYRKWRQEKGMNWSNS